MHLPNPPYEAKQSEQAARAVHYIAYGILLVSFCVALVNVWLKEEITKYAFRVDQAQQDRIALDNEIHKLTVRIEELKSPARISTIAEQLGMELLHDDFVEIRAKE